MKINSGICILAGILLLGNAQFSLSQGQSKSTANTADRDQTMDRAQTMDRNQAMDRYQTMDKDRIQQITDKDIYGAQLMTQQERDRYRKSLDDASGEQERKRIEEQHQQQMQQRAREQKVELPPVE